MQGQNIRIRLKAYDHRLLDTSTTEIVNTIKINFLLFCVFMKTKNKKIRPQVKPGKKLLYKISPKTHMSHVN